MQNLSLNFKYNKEVDMKKHLVKLASSAGMVKDMMLDSIVRFDEMKGKSNEFGVLIKGNIFDRFEGLGHIYYIEHKLLLAASSMDRIRKICIDELNDNSEKGTDPLGYIIALIDDGNLKLDSIVFEFAKKNTGLQNTLSKGLKKFFGDAIQTGVLNENDEFKEISHDEAIQIQLKKDYETEINITEAYPVFIDKLAELAKNKGNLAEIIKLVS